MRTHWKFNQIKDFLYRYWGFKLERGSSDNTGRRPGCWKSGYCVTGSLRGLFSIRFNSLDEIKKSWLMKDQRRMEPIHPAKHPRVIKRKAL